MFSRRRCLLQAWAHATPARGTPEPAARHRPEAAAQQRESSADIPLRVVPQQLGRRVPLFVFVLSDPRTVLLIFASAAFFVTVDYFRHGYMYALSRTLRSSYVAAVLMGYYWFMEMGVTDPVDKVMVRSRCHEVASEVVLDHFVELGGTYVKIGQIMSTMSHVLPLEWCTTMKACLDHSQQMKFWEPETVVIKSLGTSPRYLFSDWSTRPVKSASIAQVHEARARPDEGGGRLAVKVKFRLADSEMIADAKLFSSLAAVAQWWWPEYDFGWLARYFLRTLEQELDFEREAANSRRFAELFAGWPDVSSPRVWQRYSSRDVLTMDWVRGVNVDNPRLAAEVDTAAVAKRLAEVVAALVFEHGFVHADPHPANVFVEPLGGKGRPFRMHWLDHGLYQELSPRFRADYARLWVALVRKDKLQIEESCRALGVGNWRVLATVLSSRALVQGTAREGVMSKDDFYIPRTLTREVALGVLEILGQVPEEMILVLKCNDLLRSVQTDLGLPVNYFGIMARAAQKYLNSVDGDERAGRRRMKELERALS